MSTDPHTKAWTAWQKYCDTPYLQRPDTKTPDQLAALKPSELRSYNEQRNRYHSFMAPVQTSLMREVHDIVELVRSTNPGEGLNRTGSYGGSGYWIPTRVWSARFVA